MSGAIAHEQAQRLRSALDGVFRELGDSLDVSDSARDAFLRLVDVLESSAEAVVLPSDSVVSTQQAADLLGVSRMTVVRLIDRGELAAEGGGVHRRIAASELARYRVAIAARRKVALHGLAQEIGEETPPDQVIRTR
jgi:excisionase family DNA binding protein